MSFGITMPARTSPSFTFLITASRLSTLTTWTSLKRSPSSLARSILRPPSSIVLADTDRPL